MDRTGIVKLMSWIQIGILRNVKCNKRKQKLFKKSKNEQMRDSDFKEMSQ